jgi:hypothetical protein
MNDGPESQQGTAPTDQTVASRHIAALDFELAKLDVLERLKFQASFAQSAWQALTLVNGGAIVALFTFIGSAKPHLDQTRIWAGFVCFAVGLSFNILSILTGFLAQAWFMKATTSSAWNKQAEMHGYQPRYTAEVQRELGWGNIWEGLAICAAVVSLISFIVGSGFALAGVSLPA